MQQRQSRKPLDVKSFFNTLPPKKKKTSFENTLSQHALEMTLTLSYIA
jgi:hypothetical protein